MKVIAYENTKIKETQIINRLALADYLKEFKSTELAQDTKLLQVKQTTCNINIASTYGDNLDFFVIEDYPYFEKSYWRVVNKEFQNKAHDGSVWNYELELMPFLTFSFDEMFKNNVPISQKHINEFKEFLEYSEDNKYLKPDNYFQTMKHAPDTLNYLTKKNEVILYSPEEKKHSFIITGRSTPVASKYMLFQQKAKNEIFGTEALELTPDIRFKEDYLTWWGQVKKTAVIPLTTGSADYKDTQPIIAYQTPLSSGVHNTYSIDVVEFIAHAMDDANTVSVTILDYIPSFIKYENASYIYQDEYQEEFKSYKNWDFIKIVDKTDAVPILRYLSKDLISTTFSTTKENQFFNWTPETDIFNGTEDDYFKTENSIYLNFHPFKYFNIGISGETRGAGWKYYLNNLKQLNSDKFAFRRLLNVNNDIFSAVDIYEENSYVNDAIYKTARNMTAPISTNAYKQATENRLVNGNLDYFSPVFGLAGGLVKNPIVKAASLMGAGMSITKTIFNRMELKNQPDTQSQVSIELLNNLFIGLDTKSVITNELPLYERETIAREFHNNGAMFDNDYEWFDNKWEAEFYNTRMRFNFLKTTENATFKMFDNSLIILRDVKLLILKKLKMGIHFFNYNKEWSDILKQYIFNYNIKNPNTKEAKDEKNSNTKKI